MFAHVSVVTGGTGTRHTLYRYTRARSRSLDVRVGMSGLRLTYFDFTLRIHDTVCQRRAAESVLMYAGGGMVRCRYNLVLWTKC